MSSVLRFPYRRDPLRSNTAPSCTIPPINLGTTLKTTLPLRFQHEPHLHPETSLDLNLIPACFNLVDLIYLPRFPDLQSLSFPPPCP